jgi:acetyl-CoA acetyltransferase
MGRPITPGPAALEDVSGEVAITGVGESAMSAASGRTAEELAFEAIDAALADAGLSPHQVDGLMVTGGMAGQITPELFRAHYRTSGDIWFSQAGGAFAQAATAAYETALSFRNGRCETVLNVFGVNWASQMRDGTGGPATYHREEQMKANAELVFGFIPQPVYFATIARRHMAEYGTLPEHLGEVAVALRAHANGHPGAVMREKPLTMERYLSRQPFVDPLRVEDCCLISDGAGAFVMQPCAQAADAPKLAAIVRGIGYGGALEGTYFAQEPEFLSTPQRFAAPGAFRMAGVSPHDVDVAAIYDHFTIATIMQIEDMGFCAKGEGGAFVSAGRLRFDRSRTQGGLPLNTHGGMLSHAYTMGISHVVELVRQLRDEAANQVRDVEVAVYGGYSGSDAGVMILTKADRP